MATKTPKTTNASLVVHHVSAGTSRTFYPSYAAAERAAQRARLNPNVLAVAFRPDRQEASKAFFNHFMMEV
jgi:hypothetical protein